MALTVRFFLRGGGTKILRNTYGGSRQMLTFDDKRGGRGSKIPKYCLRNTWMFPSKCQIDGEHFVKICSLLRKHEL